MKILDVKAHRQSFEQALSSSALRNRQPGQLFQDERSEGYFALDDDLVLLGSVALAPMDWDSKFFGRLMGRVILSQTKGDQVNEALLSALERRCRELGYQHLMARVEGSAYTEVWSLEATGYELMDIGTTFVLHKKESSFRESSSPVDSQRLRLMEEKDLEFILSYVPSLFRLSYFYRDPFFSEKEGDQLHREWITNLFKRLAKAIWVCDVKGKAVGFVSCELKASGTKGTGTIALVGVHPHHTGRGLASAILHRSVQWFFEQGVESITVKTQSFNYPAINLYVKNGFVVQCTDITFCKTLR